QADGTVLIARPVVRTGQDLGLERGRADVVAIPAHPRDPLVVHLDANALRGHAAAPAQIDVPRVAGPAELAGRRRGTASLGVLQPRQCSDQIDAPDLDTGNERLGP